MLIIENKIRVFQDLIKSLKYTAKENGFKFILTGYESWFEYFYTIKQMWVINIEDCSDLESTFIYCKKLMLTIFVNCERLQLLDVKPKDVKIISNDFVLNVLKKMEGIDLVLEAISQNMKMNIHFDNAPCHNSHVVINYLLNLLFVQLERPPYSPDLAICDFGLFGSIKTSFGDQEFEDEMELFYGIEQFYKVKNTDFFDLLFKEWIRRLNLCIQLKGDYVEQTI